MHEAPYTVFIFIYVLVFLAIIINCRSNNCTIFIQCMQLEVRKYSMHVDEDIAKLGIQRIHKKLHTMVKRMTRIIDRENNKFIQSIAMDINIKNSIIVNP